MRALLGLSALMPRQADKRSKYTTSLQVLLMQEGIQAGLCDQVPICRLLTSLYLVARNSILVSWSTPSLPKLLEESKFGEGATLLGSTHMLHLLGEGTTSKRAVEVGDLLRLHSTVHLPGRRRLQWTEVQMIV